MELPAEWLAAARRLERDTSESQHSAKPRGERETERVKEEGLKKTNL